MIPSLKRALLFSSWMTAAVLLPWSLISIPAAGQESTAPVQTEVPEPYRGKQMPAGWWTDPKIISEVERIYEGKAKPRVICAACHGKFGKPKLKGARDLSDASLINRFTDDYWFWRISEGVPDTAMKAWKDSLSEEETWKVIAYSHTFSHKNKPAPHDH